MNVVVVLQVVRIVQAMTSPVVLHARCLSSCLASG